MNFKGTFFRIELRLWLVWTMLSWALTLLLVMSLGFHLLISRERSALSCGNTRVTRSSLNSENGGNNADLSQGGRLIGIGLPIKINAECGFWEGIIFIFCLHIPLWWRPVTDVRRNGAMKKQTPLNLFMFELFLYRVRLFFVAAGNGISSFWHISPQTFCWRLEIFSGDGCVARKEPTCFNLWGTQNGNILKFWV